MVDKLLTASSENDKELARVEAERQDLAAKLAGEASTVQGHEMTLTQQHGGPRRKKRKPAGGSGNAASIVDRISTTAGVDSGAATRFASLSTALVLARPVKGSRAGSCSESIFALWANEIVYMRVGGRRDGGMMWIPSLNACQRIIDAVPGPDDDDIVDENGADSRGEPVLRLWGKAAVASPAPPSKSSCQLDGVPLPPQLLAVTGDLFPNEQGMLWDSTLASLIIRDVSKILPAAQIAVFNTSVDRTCGVEAAARAVSCLPEHTRCLKDAVSRETQAMKGHAVKTLLDGLGLPRVSSSSTTEKLHALGQSSKLLDLMEGSFFDLENGDELELPVAASRLSWWRRANFIDAAASISGPTHPPREWEPSFADFSVDKLYQNNPARHALIAWRGRARGAGGSVLDVARLDAWTFAQMVTWRLKWRTWKRLSGLAAYTSLSPMRQAEVQSLALSAMGAGRWPLIATHVFRQILPVALRGLTEEIADVLCRAIGRSGVVEEMRRVPSIPRPDGLAGADDDEAVADPFERARRNASGARTSVFMLGTQTADRASASAANVRSDKLFLALTSSYFSNNICDWLGSVPDAVIGVADLESDMFLPPRSAADADISVASCFATFPLFLRVEIPANDADAAVELVVDAATR
jgi:hypothetical protein